MTTFLRPDEPSPAPRGQAVIRIAITAAAFDAIARNPAGSGGFEFSMAKTFVPRYRYDQLG
jgi:hypothetical protein